MSRLSHQLVASWAVAFVTLTLTPAVRAAAPTLLPPQPTAQTQAIYPPDAPPGATADVTLAVAVGTDGRVGTISIVTSGGPAFNAAAIAAAARWTFTPATRDGQPVAARIRLRFHFEPPAPAPGPAPSASPGPSPPPVSGPSHSPSPSPAPEPAPTPTPAEDQPIDVTPSPAPAPAPVPTSTPAADQAIDVTVLGRRKQPSRGAADFDVTIGSLALVPHKSAADTMADIGPGILLTNEGGEAHAEQVFLRGFDAREGQDIEFSAGGVPINESGNLHGNGYADTHFIIPELIHGMRLLEGPFDPRQGNYAVAGSVDYDLGFDRGGLTTKLGVGSFGTERLALLWGPGGNDRGTFAGAEFYTTDGYGQNRDGRRGTVMAQLEETSGVHRFRAGASAYLASFHEAGEVREDDYEAGRTCFFCTYDPHQGLDASRYSVWASEESRLHHLVLSNLVFGVARPMRLREDFTGFLLDIQEPQQSTHPQRGDLIDLNVMEFTTGARGSARLTGHIFHQKQELEVGYFARGDFVKSSQARVEASTNHPYHVDTNLDSRLGDIGLYLDANLKPLSWLALRGGARFELLTYDVNDLCAVSSVAHASHANPPGDASCLSQQNLGAYREPNQRASASGLAILPRASLVLGPLLGLSASLSYGRGVRSVDPSYVTADSRTPFASANSLDAGLAWAHRFPGVRLDARASFFRTTVDKDLIFSESAGRNILGGASTRTGVVVSARATGHAFDVNANLAWVHASFDDSGLLIPYIPDLVFRFNGALHGDLPWSWARVADHPVRGSLATGLAYVASRPLPYGERSDTVFTINGAASLGWGPVDLGLEVQNLLDSRYRLGEYNYASDFSPLLVGSPTLPKLVPTRHFSPGAPRSVLFTLTVHLGGAS